MTALAGIGYLLLAFSPAFALFRRFIMNDPLRIILFAIGAFFWLLSLLFSALLWFLLVPLRDVLWCSVIFSIFMQEVARMLQFILIKKAQKGLSFMTASDHHISGVHTLYHARHMLAIVCGLGMGVMAAAFLVINVVADFWGEGTVGLPATVSEVKDRFPVKLYAKDQSLPITYSLSACFLTLCHVFWTIIFWDACHKKQQMRYWWKNIAFVFASHFVFSALSFFNQNGNPVIVLILQFLVLLVNFSYSLHVIAINMPALEVGRRLSRAFLAFFCCGTVDNHDQSQRTVSEADRLAGNQSREIAT